MPGNKLTLSGMIKDGTMLYRTANHKAKVEKFIADNEGFDFMISFNAIKNIKTYEQLKFYWGVVVPSFQQHTGVGSKEEMDAFLRNEFLKTVKPVAGRVITFIPSLKLSDLELDKYEFSAYIQSCIDFLCDMGGAILEKDYTDNWIETNESKKE